MGDSLSYLVNLLQKPHPIIGVFGKCVYILVATQFRSRDDDDDDDDDSFGRLQLCNLPRATKCKRVWANRTIVTSQMNHHMI